MSVKELNQEEKYINEMFDGLEREIEKRLEHANNLAMRESLNKQMVALKKGRERRLAEWKIKADSVKADALLNST